MPNMTDICLSLGDFPVFRGLAYGGMQPLSDKNLSSFLGETSEVFPNGSDGFS